MADPTRNLVIVHMPEYQALSDWVGIRERIEARAPDIEVRIVDNTVQDEATERWQVTRPSLVFSVTPRFSYRPRGGTIAAGGSLNKIAQARRLAAAGLPGPETHLLTPALDIDPASFGAFAVVKPLDQGGRSGARSGFCSGPRCGGTPAWRSGRKASFHPLRSRVTPASARASLPENGGRRDLPGVSRVARRR